MELPKFDTSKALRSLRDEMNTVFDRFIEKPLGMITGQATPSIDLGETSTEIVVRADLPGIDLQDIDVSVTKDTLTIRGEKKKQQQHTGTNYQIVERSSGSFTRSIRLSTPVNEQKVTASYKKGVLDVVLPKKEPACERKIDIQTDE